MKTSSVTLRVQKQGLQLHILLCLFLAVGSCVSGQPMQLPVGVSFDRENIQRIGDHGDNWCMAWAADGSIVTSMCDGNWLGGGPSYHNHLYRIVGGPDEFTREDLPGYPQYEWGKGSWFGYGILSVDGILYSTVSKTPANQWSGPFRGIKLLSSADNGQTWYRVDRTGGKRLIEPGSEVRNEVNTDEMFFLEEFGQSHIEKEAYPFSFLDFVKCGQDNLAAKDNYIYIYSPEGAHAHKLLLARVPKEKLGIRSDWEYFVRYENGQPVWSENISQRGYAHIFPEKSDQGHYFGWYSWLPSVVWNEGLGCYIMVNGGTYAGHGMTSTDKDYYDSWMHTETGSLGFWYSENPYGPWHEFFYTDYWVADDARNRTYQPKLSPKWISEDGREMVLIWSDAMKNDEGRSHTVNYRWNQMKVTIETEAPLSSRKMIEHYLSRSITMLDLLNGRGDLDDNIRMLRETGARFAGRSVYRWGGEDQLPDVLETARISAAKIHAADPRLILQAAVFEIVSRRVERLPIPAWVFEAFDLAPEERNFRYEDMIYPSGRGHDQWGTGASVPDISRLETKLWFYYLAASYIQLGCEAIHFGQAEIMDGNDPEHRHWRELLQRVRAYAAEHARRGWVLCDAHVPSGGMLCGDHLLFDFHSFPLRIVETPDDPKKGVLKMGAFDSIYGRSMGGIAPGDWRCEHLPYLVELDNWGASSRPGEPHMGGCWVWGYDEMSWFAHQDPEYRAHWLRYAWDWVREHDANGYFQMPGSRVLHAPVDGHGWYYANRRSETLLHGFGDEVTIRTIWSSAD